MNPADLTLAISPTLTTKQLPSLTLTAQKNGKIPVPRVDLEPIYTQLKAGLGDQWTDYKAAVNAFLLGRHMSQSHCYTWTALMLSQATSLKLSLAGFSNPSSRPRPPLLHPRTPTSHRRQL